MHLLYAFTLPNRGRIQLAIGFVYSILTRLIGLLLFYIDISYKIHHVKLLNFHVLAILLEDLKNNSTCINLQIGNINLDAFLFFGHKDGRYM